MGEVVRLNRRNQPGGSPAGSLRTLRGLTGKSPGQFAAAVADEAGEPLPASVYMAYEEGEPAPASILSAVRRVVARANIKMPTAGQYNVSESSESGSVGQPR